MCGNVVPALKSCLSSFRFDADGSERLTLLHRECTLARELEPGNEGAGLGGPAAQGAMTRVNGIDTTNSTGRLVFGIFATLAEFERDLIKERTLAGLAAARARGRSGGRPRLMTRAKLRTAMTMMADRNNVAGEVAEQLGISVSTLYAYVDGEGQAQPCARKLLGR